MCVHAVGPRPQRRALGRSFVELVRAWISARTYEVRPERLRTPNMTHLNPKFAELGVRDEIVRALAEDGKWWVYVRVKDKSVLASKIVVDVLKRSADKEGVLIEYSSKEKALLEYLDKAARITISECCDLLKIGRRRAQRLLVDLILSGILRINTTEKEEFYSMAIT